MNGARLTHAAFAAHLGEGFDVQTGAEPVRLDLVEVNPSGSAADAARQSFSLIFAGPEAPLLPQQIHPLQHPRMGALEIFLVPLGPQSREENAAHRMRYEAVFN